MRGFRPMLAGTYESLDEVQLPCYVSLKYDGIRAWTRNSEILSRTGKLIRNRHIQRWASKLPPGLDGELMIWRDKKSCKFANFEAIDSAVMSYDGEPNFVYMVFDHVTTRFSSFRKRQENLKKIMEQLPDADWTSRIQMVPQHYVNLRHDLEAWYNTALEEGFEGLMVRDPLGFYKYGRSEDGGLMKLKPWFDAEALVVGMEEQLQNCNPEKRNEIGYMKRSFSSSGMKPAGTLGKFLCWNKQFGEFKCGTGHLTAKQKQRMFDEWPLMKDSVITFRYRSVTSKGKPRSPNYWRIKHA